MSLGSSCWSGLYFCYSHDELAVLNIRVRFRLRCMLLKTKEQELNFSLIFPQQLSMSYPNKILYSTYWKSMNEWDVFLKANTFWTATVASLKGFILKNDDQCNFIGYRSAPEKTLAIDLLLWVTI